MIPTFDLTWKKKHLLVVQRDVTHNYVQSMKIYHELNKITKVSSYYPIKDHPEIKKGEFILHVDKNTVTLTELVEMIKAYNIIL